MPVKVTGGDCQEMLKLLPLGVNFVDPGMFTGGVACLKRKYYSSKRTIPLPKHFKGSFTSQNCKSASREKNFIVLTVTSILLCY